MHGLPYVCFIGFSIIGTSLPAMAQERWEATSTAAFAVTGNVVFSERKITFQNGRFLTLDPVQTIENFEVGELRGPATVYRVTSRGNPILLHGNFLCGKERLTYILVLSDTSFNGRPARLLSVYTGELAAREPAGNCAIFNYEIALGNLSVRTPATGQFGGLILHHLVARVAQSGALAARWFCQRLRHT